VDDQVADQNCRESAVQIERCGQHLEHGNREHEAGAERNECGEDAAALIDVRITAE
jgi:hypothetical protein